MRITYVRGRRRCRCHGEPMDWRPGRRTWECAVRRRARQLAAYNADAAAKNYARGRRALRARLRSTPVRIAALEEELARLGVRLPS